MAAVCIQYRVGQWLLCVCNTGWGSGCCVYAIQGGAVAAVCMHRYRVGQWLLCVCNTGWGSGCCVYAIQGGAVAAVCMPGK